MWKYYRSKHEKFLCSFQKIQNNVNRIHLQCSGFIEILDMIIRDPTELKTYWIWSNSKHSIKYTHLAIPFPLAVSPRNSSQQSATAEGFAEANSVFIVIILAYSESPGILKTRGIFRTLLYLKLWHIQNQRPALQIKNLLVPVNWSFSALFRPSSYFPQWSHNYCFDFA